MKVLFVCRGNVGRSQMAAAFYNQLTNTKDADSAGTHVENPGQTLLERKLWRPGHSFVVDVMAESGIDVTKSVSTQLNPDMLKKYGLIVSMAGKRYTPKWLADSPNYMFWKIRDPMGRSHDATARARDIVKKNIEELILNTAR